MTQRIKNLFKNNIYFTYIKEFDDSDVFGGEYKSNVIYDLITSEDLMNKIKPFLYYLSSECLKRKPS